MRVPTLPDTFLAGSAPRFQTIHFAGIPFPTASTLLSSSHDLVDVVLDDIPQAGYISPEAMVVALAALPRLEDFTLGFNPGISYPDRICLPVPPITRTRPAITSSCFEGPLGYFEDLVAQIDAPHLDCLRIKHWDQQDFQIPQLCKFVDRSEKLSSQFRRALLLVNFDTVAIYFFLSGSVIVSSFFYPAGRCDRSGGQPNFYYALKRGSSLHPFGLHVRSARRWYSMAGTVAPIHRCEGAYYREASFIAHCSCAQKCLWGEGHRNVATP